MARILIVEDHPANLKLARLILESAGHEVLARDNAVDGLQAACDLRPEVILMDIQLPGMDGLEAIRRLKADRVTVDIPVIALTAFAMRDDAKRMHAAGCDGYLAKPYRRADLLKAVTDALDVVNARR
ncbi:MAG TPA: response regulator [Casimicrobiaceae bacterium]|nr:response regulator [Casimicrobiaceae bacterium]